MTGSSVLGHDAPQVWATGGSRPDIEISIIEATAAVSVAAVAETGWLPWCWSVNTTNGRKDRMMKVLVAYTSRHGATAGIAERIAEKLNARGHQAHAVEVEQVEELAGAEEVVIGAAAYMFHWLKPALRFVEHHREELAKLPVWLFSSGPLGTDTVDKAGDDVLASARPKWGEVAGGGGGGPPG